MSSCDQSRGYDWPPASPSYGVKEPANGSQWEQFGSHLRLRHIPQRSLNCYHAYYKQIDAHKRSYLLSWYSSKNIRSKNSPYHSWNQESPEHPLIHVPKSQVQAPRDAAREYLGSMSTNDGSSWQYTTAEQKGSGNNSIRHSKSPINNLSEKTYDYVGNYA